jgi:hypothetical protein
MLDWFLFPIGVERPEDRPPRRNDIGGMIAFIVGLIGFVLFLIFQ